MSTYQSVFNRIVGDLVRGIHIISYDYTEENKDNNYNYFPYHHGLEENSSFILGSFLRKHIIFSSYSEKEIIKKYDQGQFDQLEKLVQVTKKNRLPDREGSTNGLYGEVLLDLILNLQYPEIYKACIRTLHRQRTDNSELKGFDSMHILLHQSENGNLVNLMLGQAKLGTRAYCLSKIKEDLDKLTFLYTYDELSFVSDKVESLDIKIQKVLENMNNFFFKIEGYDVSKKKEEVKRYFKESNIKLTVPCLVAYDRPSIYVNDNKSFLGKFIKELDSVIDNMEKHKVIDDQVFDISVLFIVFPIREINKLREGMDYELQTTTT